MTDISSASGVLPGLFELLEIFIDVTDFPGLTEIP
jgi:hypothetical protein